jgi:DNA mismatch repair protein PMS2
MVNEKSYFPRSLFGSKQMGVLRQLEQADLNEGELAELGWRGPAAPCVRLVGWLSSCVHGEGRASPDRQFYYINSRPCDPTRISKVVNEVRKAEGVGSFMAYSTVVLRVQAPI